MAEKSYVFRLLGEPGQLQSATEAAARSIESLSAKTDAANRSGGAGAAQAAAATRTVGSAAQEAGKAVHGFSFETASAKRELLVLAHELSQGNFKRFGGSLLVLAEQTGAASLLFSGLGAAALGAAAGVGAFAVAVAIGAHETAALNNDLAVSGNYAGTTAGQFTAMARSIAESADVGIGKARDALQGLVQSGQIGPQVLGPAATAIVLLEKRTGASADEIVKDFAKMGDGVAKWAVEHNKALNFITGEQYAYIKGLEEQGKKEEAEVETLRLLTLHLNALPENLGSLGRAWKYVGEQASGAWEAMKGVGRAETLDDRISRLQEQLKSVRSLGPDEQARTRNGFTSGGEAISDELRLAQLGKRAEREQALRTAESARVEKARIGAIELRDRYLDETKGVTLLNKELEKYHRLVVEPLRGTANEISAGEQSATEAALRKKFNPAAAQGDKSGENFIQQLARQLEQQTKGREEMLRLEAAQKGVAAAAQPYIDKLEAIELRQARIKRVVEETARDEEQRARVTDLVSGGNDQAKAIIEQTEALGLNGEALTRLTAKRDMDNRVAAKMANATSETRAELERVAEVMRSNVGAAIDEQIDKQRALTAASRETAAGIRTALDKYTDDAGNQAAFAARVVEGGLSRTEDAITRFVETGKGKLGDLWRFMADEFIRQQVRMQLASVAGSGGSLAGLLGTLGSLYNGSYNSNYGNEGHNYPPPVTPSADGASLQALGANSRVRAASLAGNGAITIINNVAGAQVSAQRDGQGGTQVLIDQIVDQAHSRIAADIGMGTGRVSSAMKARGMSLGNGNVRRT